MTQQPILAWVAALGALLAGAAIAAPEPPPVRDALAKAARYFRSIATEGGYLWRYSLDLKERAGENVATDTQIWVQPPGTPAVGEALLRAWRATGNREFLDAARAAADALVRGQLESGGWDYRVEFDPKLRIKWNYRGGDGGRNTSILDDDNTQSALRLLMDVHAASPNGKLKDAIDYGLAALLKAQYPNGAFPQRFPSSSEAYGAYYTFNDNVMGDVVDTLLTAFKHYGDQRYLDAVRKVGDFMILSQRPEPQPIWAQQYDLNMKPAWARKFEPASVCAGESVGVMRCLIRIWLETGDEKYLKPIPPALAWYQRSQIAPNRWARFYELETNRPLYFTTKYELVYTDRDLPTHYVFQASFGAPEFMKEYEQVRRQGLAKTRALRSRKLSAAERAARRQQLEPGVREIIAALDEQGRWVTDGQIQCRTFIRNLDTLSEYLEMSR